MFLYRRVSKDCRVPWNFALILAGFVVLFQISCLPKAPPPLVSSINSAAVQMGSGPSMVLSQRAAISGLLASLGLGYWFSERMEFSGAFDLAVNMPPSGNSDEVWPQFALSIGLDYRFDPT